MADSIIRGSVGTGWCCSGLQPAPHVCTLTVGLPNDCLSGDGEGFEEPAWFDKSRLTHAQLPSVYRSLSAEMESLKVRVQQCEQCLDRVFGSEKRDQYRLGLEPFDDARTTLCRIIDEFREGQLQLQRQVSDDQDTIRALGDKAQELQRKIEASSEVQTNIEGKLSDLSLQVTECATHDPLAMGPQLGKSLNTCEWGALFAESKREIEECRHRIDDLVLEDSAKLGKLNFDGDGVRDVKSWPTMQPTAAAAVPSAWMRDSNARPEPNVLGGRPVELETRLQESERQLQLMRQATASAPVAGGQDRWRPLPLMRPPAVRKNTS